MPTMSPEYHRKNFQDLCRPFFFDTFYPNLYNDLLSRVDNRLSGEKAFFLIYQFAQLHSSVPILPDPFTPWVTRYPRLFKSLGPVLYLIDEGTPSEHWISEHTLRSELHMTSLQGLQLFPHQFKSLISELRTSKENNE